nr:MAG TPA: hypothetical protein [Caudoviricetes sp.]
MPLIFNYLRKIALFMRLYEHKFLFIWHIKRAKYNGMF